MKIAVVGTGYVGLVAGACLAENGNDVDLRGQGRREGPSAPARPDPDLRAGARGAGPPQPRGKAADLHDRPARGRARARRSSSSPSARRRARTAPPTSGTSWRSRARSARAMNGYKVIVEQEHRPGRHQPRRSARSSGSETTHPFSVVSNPEFLKQGAAIDDFMKPDRVVVGAEDERAAEMMHELYAPFTRTGAPIMMMDCASAELCKYAANAMLATRISFMNEVANVCEAVGADVDQVRRAVASDRRIGPSFLFPGVGYGGSCFPKDVKAMLQFAAREELRLPDPEGGRGRQRAAEGPAARQDAAALRHRSRARRIAVWGLAFKPRTDDMREAPAVPLIEALLDAGAAVQAYDPEAMKVARAIFGVAVDFADKSYDALEGRRRAGDRHRVERVPRAGLRAHARS